jgi:hypothetical protein
MVFAIMVASSTADPTAPWEGHTIPTVPAVRKYAARNVIINYLLRLFIN